MSKKTVQIAFALSMITQIGLSILIPAGLCIFAAGWLQKRFALGSWIILLGIVIGVGSSICSMVNVIRIINKRLKEEKEEEH